MNYKFILNNADTDSIMFSKPDGIPFTEEEQNSLLKEVNKLMPKFIEWNNDGYYPSVVIIKSKNYVMFDGNRKHIKGSGFKSSNKEPALKELMNEIVDELLADASIDKCVEIYHKYIKEAINIQDISRWSVKKTVTSKLLTSERANETKVVDAIGDDRVQEGDKIWVYSAIDGMIESVDKDGNVKYDKKTGQPKMEPNYVLKQSKDWDIGMPNEDKMHYVERVYKTVDILSTVLPIERFKKYHLKKFHEDLDKL